VRTNSMPAGYSLKGNRWHRALLTAILTFILGLAAYLRLAGLGAESLWLDEGYTVAFTGLPFGKMVAYIATRDVHPPLYYILIKLWRSMGDSEAWLRLPSVAFGIAAVAYMWGMVEEHWGAPAAAASSLLLATSSVAVYYSQEARMYSLVFLLTVLSLRFFLRFVTLFQVAANDGKGDSPPRAAARDCVGLTVFTLALLYTHNVTVFLWGGQLLAGGALGLWLLIRSRQKGSGYVLWNPPFRQWLVCQAVIGAFYLPWLLVLFGQSANVASRFWTIPPSVDTVWNIFRIVLMRLHPDEPMVWDITGFIVGIVALKVVLDFRDVKGLVLGSSVVLPLLMSYLYSIYRTPIMAERTLIFVGIPLLALIGSFVTIPPAKAGIFTRTARVLQVAAGLAIYALLVVLNVGTWQMEQHVQTKEDFRAAASNALRIADRSTAVVFNNAASQAAFDYYFHRSAKGRSVDEYSVPCHYLEVPEGNANLEPLVTQDSVWALDKRILSRQKVVLVRSHVYYSDPSGLLKRYFDSHWRFERDISVKGVEMLIYNRN
jgi:mannosyltransferase